MQPSYYVTIQRLDTEQRAFSGFVSGPLAPLLEGAILENVRVIDAGERLTAEQRKRARPHAR